MTKNKKVKIYQVGDDDHTSYPRSSARKKANVKANERWDTELFTTKLNIPNNVPIKLLIVRKMFNVYFAHGKTF